MNTRTVQLADDRSVFVRITRPPKTTKPLLVFLHYWGGSSATWRKLTSNDTEFTASSMCSAYRTMSFDLPGSGFSIYPEDGPDKAGQFAPTSMANDVLEVLHKLKMDRDTSELFQSGIVLIGHSMGAKVAMVVAALMFRSTTFNLRGLVLVAPAPATPLRLPAEMREQSRAAYTNRESLYWTIENILAEPQGLTKEDVEQTVHDSLCMNPSAKTAWPTYGMDEDVSKFFQTSLENTAPAKLRVVVMVGTCDKVEPAVRVESETVNWLRGLGVEADFEVVKGVGHLLPLERPEAIAGAIRLRFGDDV